MSSRREPAPNRRQSGVTLIELIASIVVVSIAVAGILGVFTSTVGRSADPMLRHQAVAIAEAYLEEILLKPFADPDGIDGEALRSMFDDVDDYDGPVDAGARDQFDNPLAGLGDYTISVTVATSGALPAVGGGDALLVDVTVTRASDVAFTLSGYRTNL